ncbi:12361_t:CDS:1, partial [Ambispora gerdemannii]
MSGNHRIVATENREVIHELKVKESSSNSNKGSNSQSQQNISANYQLTEKLNQGNNNL